MSGAYLFVATHNKVASQRMVLTCRFIACGTRRTAGTLAIRHIPCLLYEGLPPTVLPLIRPRCVTRATFQTAGQAEVIVGLYQH